MKFSIALLALLGTISAEQIEKHHAAPIAHIDDHGYVVFEQAISRNKKDLPSDEVANGDAMENRDLETEADHNDDIVEDHGFSGSRGAVIRARAQKSKKSDKTNLQLNAQVNTKTKTKGLYDYEKPSEYLCDGDGADDKEILDSADPEDDIVEDFGFSGSRNARGQVRMLVQLDSQAPESTSLLATDDYPINQDHMNLLYKNSDN